MKKPGNCTTFPPYLKMSEYLKNKNNYCEVDRMCSSKMYEDNDIQLGELLQGSYTKRCINIQSRL